MNNMHAINNKNISYRKEGNNSKDSRNSKYGSSNRKNELAASYLGMQGHLQQCCGSGVFCLIGSGSELKWNDKFSQTQVTKQPFLVKYGSLFLEVRFFFHYH